MTTVYIDPIHGAALTAGLLPILPGLPCPTCAGRSEFRDDMFGSSPCPDCADGVWTPPDHPVPIGVTSARPEVAAHDDELSGPVRILNEDVESGRREVREWDLDERTAAKARAEALVLLEELSTDRGFSWSDIARLCGVSVSAVRKWRSGETPSPERRRDLARLAAFVDLLDEIAPIADPATWMLMRLVDRHTVTAAHLYLEGRSNDLLEHAQGHLGVNDLLDRWNPDWRSSTQSDWQVVVASDGHRIVVASGRGLMTNDEWAHKFDDISNHNPPHPIVLSSMIGEGTLRKVKVHDWDHEPEDDPGIWLEGRPGHIIGLVLQDDSLAETDISSALPFLPGLKPDDTVYLLDGFTDSIECPECHGYCCLPIRLGSDGLFGGGGQCPSCLGTGRLPCPFPVAAPDHPCVQP